MRGSLFLRLLTLLVAAGQWCGTVPGQENSPVRLKIESLSIRGRSGGPIPIQIKLDYSASQLLEGDLILEVYNSFVMPDELLARIRYEGVVLQGTDYIFNTVLPPVDCSNNKQYRIVGWLETAEGRLSLSLDPEDPAAPHDLLTPGPFERSVLMASVSGRNDFMTSRATREYLNRAFSPERYNPLQDLSTGRGYGPGGPDTLRIQYFACSWDARGLPEDPLQLCSFDIVLLTEGALCRLTETQLEALTVWVKAGGSLCVHPDGTSLTRLHERYLQTWFERDWDPGFHVAVTDNSRALLIGDEEAPIIHRRLGLGRLTLLPVVDDLRARLSEPELGRTVGHLWKFRSDSGIYRGNAWVHQQLKQGLAGRSRTIVRKGDKFIVVQENQASHEWGQLTSDDLELYNTEYQLQPMANPLSSAAETTLMPDDVEMVPASVIALLLIAYVVTIGPVDYYVLGYFRARKYTWLLFPVVTAAFTMLTVKIAHNYMATTDTGGTLTIVDLLEDNKVARKNVLQMHFYGSRTTLREDSKNAFMVPGQMAYSLNDYGRNTPQSLNRSIGYSGRFPQSYSSEQTVRQWEPQVNRTMVLAPEIDDLPNFPWDSSQLFMTDTGRKELQQKVEKLGTDRRLVDGILLNGSAQYPLVSGGFLFSDNLLSQSPDVMEAIEYGYYAEINERALRSSGLMEATRRSAATDYFGVVSQVSPQGSASLEDLPILDPTNVDEWVLMIAVRDGANTTVYRRLYDLSHRQVQPQAAPDNSGVSGETNE